MINRLMPNHDPFPFGWTEAFLSKVSRVYNRSCGDAVHMGFHCVRNTPTTWLNDAVPVFWQPCPDVSKGHSHYFAFARERHGKIVILDGSSAFEEGIQGVIADDGEIIYSRYRNDYVVSQDGSVFIDGGRDYTKTNVLNPERTVTMTVSGPNFRIDGPNFFHIAKQGNFDVKNHPNQR